MCGIQTGAAAGTERATQDSEHIRSATVQVIAAYVANNSVKIAELPGLIKDVLEVFQKLDEPLDEPQVTRVKPAIPVSKSVTYDHIICLECGCKFRTIKRHLRASHNLLPRDYREKWNLAGDYPMVAPTYAKQRSNLAIKLELGRKSRIARGELMYE